jgi:hypothetical protein
MISPKTFSLTGALAAATAVHASIAGAITPQVIATGFTNPVPATAVVPAVLLANSVVVSPARSPVARIVTVTTAAAAASYALSPITIKGTDSNGNAITDTVTPTLVGGAETLPTAKAFVTVTEVDIPIQPGTGGGFTIGVSDLVLASNASEIRAAGAGALALGFEDGTSDVVPLVLAGEHLPYAAARIFATTTTITAGLTVRFADPDNTQQE